MSLIDNWFDEDELYKCVHCGFCLQSCPTYLETGLETESPRGRIALMKAVNESRIEIDHSVIGHWDLCIQCRACEVACPQGSHMETSLRRRWKMLNHTGLEVLRRDC